LSAAESRVSELEDKLEKVSGDVDSVSDSFDTLKSSVDDFAYGENWRDVVPDVESAVVSLESDLDELKSDF
jgi:archaellum component FlaC